MQKKQLLFAESRFNWYEVVNHNVPPDSVFAQVNVIDSLLIGLLGSK